MARPSPLTFKDHFRETHLFQQRVLVAVVLLALVLCLIIARLVYLQVINHEHYTTLSEDNRINILPIPPIRGLIYDRNGVLLAQNLPSFTLQIIPEHVKDLASSLT